MLKEYRTLLPYYKEYKFKYLFGLLCLTVTNAGQLMIPQYIRRSLNLMTEDQIDTRSVLKLVATMVVVAFIIALGRFFWRYFIHGASRRIEKELRGQIFYHLLEMSSSFFGKNKTGDIMARMTNDMKAIRMASGMALVAFVDGLFMALAILWILFSRYPRLAAITILPLPLITIVVLFMGSFLGERFRQVQAKFSDLTSSVQETMSGIRVLKSFNREDHALKEFNIVNDSYIKANISLVKIWGLMTPLTGFLTGLTACLLLFFGGRMVIWGELNPGDFVAVMAYLGMLAWPMVGAGFTVNLIQRGAASLQRINQILDEKAEIRNVPNPLDVDPFKELEIQNLNFHYGEDPIINDLSLKITAGETLGVLGRTGSGKSTLINLLPRILESPRGSILYNGMEIHNLELSSLRKSILLIPQEAFLFSASILENILLGKKDATEKEVQEVIEMTTLDRDLKNFPNGVDTQVGEKGISLSGGQKQRIALARALIANPQVLILDDALSAVDTKTEEFILSRFFARREGLTSILISHRVSTLMNAGNIIVLEKGRISQKGTHQDLIQEKGLYQSIYKLQSLDKS
ncbi:ABC transporter ATP-binding protein [Oceanispirochaeta crateris]|uniref:Multidrug resistance-like ATP-binding protein MdlA n=1 Tax=Oceanispirochaeta crateris TaxID=2518645 RepID=A0A5C1QIH1_9SPIO|nr:ABC transporter ATP-binding protein [Oceanispirochaeta crateris]QEN07381.1 ABC transporter ATP-binding protein [Oceanispirochaeta crateris]